MSVPIRTALVPLTRKQRTGRKLTGSRTATIHNTANPNATAANHSMYLNNADRTASWHITVDDKEAVIHIPLDEQAWHTGTSQGNASSIGIEVCEFTDAARGRKAESNAAWVAAWVLRGQKLPITALRTHKSWSGKNCPRLILPRWGTFVASVAGFLNPAPKPKPEPVKEAPKMEHFEELCCHTRAKEHDAYRESDAAFEKELRELCAKHRRAITRRAVPKFAYKDGK